jgi:hypothetical protein
MSGFAADEITHCIRNRLADFPLFIVADPDPGSGAFLILNPKPIFLYLNDKFLGKKYYNS